MIRISSSSKSYETDLEETADQMWPALLSCKNFLSKSSILPRTQYFLKFDDKNAWRYFVPETFHNLNEKNRSFKSVITFKSDQTLEKRSYMQKETNQSRKTLTIYENDLTKADFIKKISKVYKSETKLLKASIVLSLYLPFIIGEWRAKQDSTVFVTGHLTQSIDGKIAKKDGQPVWLGGEEDKKHTHRLRSLHQALLIGSKTVEKDNPQLTVRHCKGQNPIPIIFLKDKQNIFEKRLFQEKKRKVILISKMRTNQHIKEKNREFNTSILTFSPNQEIISPKELLCKLKDKNINSVFIEGGGITISHFLLSNSLNRFHLHVTSKKLNEGINSFTVPTSFLIDQMPTFKRIDHKIKDQILMDFIPVHE